MGRTTLTATETASGGISPLIIATFGIQTNNRQRVEHKRGSSSSGGGDGGGGGSSSSRAIETADQAINLDNPSSLARLFLFVLLLLLLLFLLTGLSSANSRDN